jgi:transposase
LIAVEQWAEIRRMHFVEGLSIKAIARRTGRDRKTIRRAIRSPEPPGYSRPPGGSKLDPHREQIAALVRDVEGITNTRIRELITEAGYQGSKTILDDYLRELRPILRPKRTYQRTIYRPGELAQFDLIEPRREIPVGHGQTRKGYVVTCELGWSRAAAGALVFSKRFDDIAFGMSHCLSSLGALPETIIWDREGAIHDGHGHASEDFAAFCGRLMLGWRILQARDPESKGALERTHRFMRTSFEPARSFANPLDFQDQLDAGSESEPTGAFTAASAPFLKSVCSRRRSVCARCLRRCPPLRFAASFVSRNSPTSALTRTTTRWTPASPDAGSSSRSASRRSSPPRSTPASSAPGTPAPSRAI